MSEVLDTGEAKSIKFVSMLKDRTTHRVVSQEMTRAGLSSQYRKRKLDPDGINTTPLGLILRGGITPEKPEEKKRRIDLSLLRQSKLTPSELFK